MPSTESSSLPPPSLGPFTNIIAGKPSPSSSSSRPTTHSLDPSNRQALWSVPVATESDLDDAVKAARNAFPAWSKMKWEERGKLLVKARDVLAGVKEEMAEIVLREGGKPVRVDFFSPFPLTFFLSMIFGRRLEEF